MIDQGALKYAGEASWQTRERQGTAQVNCVVQCQNRLALELAWNNVTYVAWLDLAEADVYSGIYEVVTLRKLLRGKATCILKPAEGGVQVRGIFEEQLLDYVWCGRLVNVTDDKACQ